MRTVKETLGDKKARFYFIDVDWAATNGIYDSLVNSTLDVWKDNLNKRITEIQVADVCFSTIDGECDGKVIMVR